ncbi:MAG TPA: endo-1,4-beta-xylanase, partial [Clostridia bacterium]|nr:endo-1,4-beta-xylanase [Clostridia bacterium]
MSTQLDHRRGAALVTFVDRDGAPLAGKSVRYEQLTHQFLFGFGAFDAVDLAGEDLLLERKAALMDRMSKMLALFNYGTLPFYWGRFEPEEGEPQTEALLRAADWLRGRGVMVKGHPLCWHTVCAPWLMRYDNPTILQKQLARIRREAADFRGRIDTWDVINEVVIMPVFDRYDNAVTRIAKDLGRVGIVRAVFEAARETNPGATLILNDFDMSPAYERLIADCLDAGVRIDVIGLQSHQHQGYWGMDKLQDVLRRFSRFGLPLHFTENTLISGDLMPRHIADLNDWQVKDWPSTPEGEERQAREVEEMYTALFAHPRVEAVTVWNAADGKWLNAPS